MKNRVGIGCAMILIVGLFWLEAQTPINIVRASDPTLDAADAIIRQATRNAQVSATAVAAQQTAQAGVQTAQAVSVIQTAEMIDLNKRQSDADATRAAQQTRLYIDTQSLITSRNATATASWLNGQATRTWADATDTANMITAVAKQTHAAQTETLAVAQTTQTAEINYRDGTSTKVAITISQSAQTQRESIATFGLSGIVITVLVVLILIAARLAMPLSKQTRTVPVSQVTNVEIVSEPDTVPEPAQVKSAPPAQTIILAQADPTLPAVRVILPNEANPERTDVLTKFLNESQPSDSNDATNANPVILTD